MAKDPYIKDSPEWQKTRKPRPPKKSDEGPKEEKLKEPSLIEYWKENGFIILLYGTLIWIAVNTYRIKYLSFLSYGLIFYFVSIELVDIYLRLKFNSGGKNN